MERVLQTRIRALIAIREAMNMKTRRKKLSYIGRAHEIDIIKHYVLAWLPFTASQCHCTR